MSEQLEKYQWKRDDIDYGHPGYYWQIVGRREPDSPFRRFEPIVEVWLVDPQGNIRAKDSIGSSEEYTVPVRKLIKKYVELTGDTSELTIVENQEKEEKEQKIKDLALEIKWRRQELKQLVKELKNEKHSSKQTSR